MRGTDVLARLAIAHPAVRFAAPVSLERFLNGNTIALAAAVRHALDGDPNGITDLVHEIDSAAPWAPLAAGVVVAAEVLAHLADHRSAAIPQVDPSQR